MTTRPSGVRVVTEAVPAVRSVALGFFVASGSATEDEPRAGWSHLLEHMLFRGSASYGSTEIDELFDAMGAELNAGTDKDVTSVYSRVLDVHLERAFDAMADMVWRPRLAAEDLESEREIVIEEIAMYEDDPQDRVFELLERAVFAEHPLGRPVIGTRQSVGAAQAGALQRFHAERYAPRDIVVAAAGSVDHEALVALVAAAEEPAGAALRAPVATPPAERPGPCVTFLAKDTEQYHLALGGGGIARHDERRYALRVLDTILGGSPSSRLFQEVREKRGLAYSVFSFQNSHAVAGDAGVYVGTRAENVELALTVVAEELERLCEDGVTQAELVRAREHAQGRIVLGLESTGARMTRLGFATLAELPLLSVEQLIERVEAISADDVLELARELYDPRRLGLAAIGPDEQLLRGAVSAALPALEIPVPT